MNMKVKYLKAFSATKKTLALVVAFIIIFGVGMPQMVHAKNRKVKNPALVNLSLNTTYTGYDITGDGKRDTIRISSTSLDDYLEKGLTVKINGKEALCNKEWAYYKEYVSLRLCTLKNGKVYLYIYNPADNAVAEYCGLFQYDKGKLKCALDMKKFNGLDKFADQVSGAVKSVSGNRITVEMIHGSYEIGGIHTCFDYKYSKGKLIRTTNIIKDFDCWFISSNGGKLTARNDIKVYAKTNCKTKAFTLKAGEQIKVKSIYCKSGKMLLKVQRLSDGKNGYIKCIKHHPKDGRAPFTEVEYAG